MHRRIPAALIASLMLSLFAMGKTQSSATEPPASSPGTTVARQFSKEDASYVVYDQPLIAFTNVELIDGTGSGPKRDVTVVVQGGRISAIGPARKLKPPSGATVIDGHGKTLLPGFVMVHEHMFYPSTRKGAYLQLPYSFSRLYLAGGTTTMRTAGTLSPDADLNVRRAIIAGRQPGPDMDVTGPYLGGPSEEIPQLPRLSGPEEAARIVNFWAAEGVHSYKAYTQITRAELKAVIDAAHARGLKVTGHLCSVTYREAAELGIDNLEHDFEVLTDFVPDKKPDACPPFPETLSSIAKLEPDGAEIGDLMDELIARKVALTSTLAIFETLTAGQPKAADAALELLTPQLRAAYEQQWSAMQSTPFAKTNAEVLPKLLAWQRRFVRKGGVLLAGTDPTGFGGVIPGFSARRQLELMVQGGFTFPAAVQICTLNGARFLDAAADVGSVEVGKRADLLLIDGDPVADLSALQRMPYVFKAGVGYRTQAIFEALRGKVGLY
jgi:imidazolonepropionase-like amidohydrolase